MHIAILLFTLILLSADQICCAEINLPLRESPGYSVYSSNPKFLSAVRVDQNGLSYTSNVLKQQLASDLQLPLRDLRIVDPSFPSQIQATFAARPNAILFALENIKVIVKHNEAIIFSPQREEVLEYVPTLQHQIQSAVSGRLSSSIDLESSHSPRMAAGSMRFEHIVIEAALNVVCNNLYCKVRALAPAIKSALQGLQAESRGLDIIQTQVDELLPLKNQLDELKKRVQEIDRAIKEVLDNDEDMSMMHLGDRGSEEKQEEQEEQEAAASSTAIDVIAGAMPGEGSADNNSVTHSYSQIDTVSVDVDIDAPLEESVLVHHSRWKRSRLLPPKILKPPHLSHHNQHSQHSQAHRQRQEDATISFEMMLENYLNEIGWINSEVSDILDTITNTEENVALQIDLLRNRILRFELTLSMSSFIVSCAALVTGLFGMNLLNHVEHQPVLFWGLTAALMVGMAASYGRLRWYGKREKLF